MVNERVMLEGSRIGGGGGGGDEERENENGIELSLELSISGSYAKSKKLMASGVKSDVDLEETGRSFEEFGVCVDPQAKKDIQALWRQEARKKREGKLKRVNWKEMNGYGSSGNSSGGGVSIDNVDGIMESASKRGKNVAGIVGENQGSIPMVPAQFTNEFVNLYGGNEVKSWKCGFQSAGGRSFRQYQGNENLERRCGKEGWPANASMSPGWSSSAFLNYQNSNLGGNTSDNGSNSSYTRAKMQQQKNVPAPSNPPEQSDHNGSSKQTEQTKLLIALLTLVQTCPNPMKTPKSDTDQSSSLINNPIPTTSNTNQGLPKEMSESDTSRPFPEPKMSCVTTTENGPSGKTVTGFLYRYNKKEVSIVCVCHGSSFSPSEFVEHAGGVDITHPLRHITVIPSAFG